MMKLRPRELVLMTLPVALLSGIAWYFGRGGTVGIADFFDTQTPRIKYTTFQVVAPTEYQVWQGYTWKAQTRRWDAGRLDLPRGWTTECGYSAPTLDRWLVYRRGSTWLTAPQAKGKTLVSRGFEGTPGWESYCVRLDTIPRDAEEVRLRGRFESTTFYSGRIPAGWSAPSYVKIQGAQRIVSLVSQPFDVSIKAPGAPFPAPSVAMTPQVEVLDARYFADGGQFFFGIHLRHRALYDWRRMGDARVEITKIFDARGRPVTLFTRGGRGPIYSSWGGALFPQPLECYSGMPHNEIVTGLWDADCAPRGGWKGVPFPLRVQAHISDGSCWPLAADLVVQAGRGKMGDFWRAQMSR